MKKLVLLISILISTTVFGQRMLIPSLTGNAGVQTKSGVTTAQISWTTNSTSATYSPSYINNTGGDLTWETSGAVIIPTEIEGNAKPILSNFRIEDATPTLVHFDASKDISTLTSTGFTISGKTISSITIDGDNLGGYFTVSVAFTFWDNNTIRLESGNGAVHDFTLTHIRNDIVEPTAATIRYASATGSGSNSGLDQSNEWTYQQAFTNATAGMTVYLKAGNSTSGVVCSASGTSSNPIKFIGYKTTPNDITTNYYDYTVKGSTGVNTAEMPTLTGTSKTSGIGVAFGGYDYIIIKNLQVEQFYYQFHSRATNNPSNYIVMERVNGHDAGAIGANDAHGVVFRSYDPTISYYIGSNNIRLKNSTFINHTQGSVVITGDGSCLLDNVKTYSDKYETDPERNDYHIAIGGWDNIIKDCYSENFNNTTTNLSTHGIGIRGAEQWDYTGKVGSQYNLIVGSESVNSYDGLYFRNYRSDNNVAKNNIVRGNGNFLAERSGGLGIMSGCDNNVFENNYVENVYWATYWTDNSEDGSSDTHTGDNNIIRNNIFKNCRDQIWATATANTTAVNNKFYNNTFYSTNSNGFGYAGFYQDADGGTYDNGISGWEFKNNLVTIHYEHASVPSGITSLADYNNFDGAYTGFGTNKTTLNPNFVNLVDFVPQEAGLIAGTTLTGVEYDYNQDERDPTTTTIGAIRIEDYPTPPSNHIYSGNNLPTFDLSGSAGGTTTITASSNSAFNNLTQLGLVSDEVLTANLTSATDLQLLEIKINNDFTSANLTTLLNLEELTIRSNPSQTSLDLSGNSVLWELYAYDNALTTLDVSNNPLLTTVVISGNDLPSGEIDQVIIDLAAHGLSSGTLNYSGNTGPPTSASYAAYNTLFNRNWSIIGTVPPDPIPDPPSSSVAGLPIISNFHVKDGEGTRVYFDTNETITATNTTGFTISGQTISNIFINGATETGHYFTISPGVTFWDNNTIRYEGGSNLVDSDTNALADFTLEHIRNDIVEPTAATIRYANATGSGLADGTSEANAWSYSQAFTNATAGMTVYVKAGSSSANCVLGNAGTISSPIKFIGYKTTINDIISNYYDNPLTGDVILSTEMPTLNGGNRETGTGILSDNPDGSTRNAYVIIKNFNITQYNTGISLTDSDGFVLERINAVTTGSVTGYGRGITSWGSWATYTVPATFRNTKGRIVDCRVTSASGDGINANGNGLLVANCKVYEPSGGGVGEVMDYSIPARGDNIILKDNYVYRNPANGHGNYFGFKSEEDGWNGKADLVNVPTRYGLADGNTTENIFRALKARNVGTDYCVFKNNTVINGNISMFGGPKYCIWENNYLSGGSKAIDWYNNVESIRVGKITEGNIVRNNIFKTFTWFLYTKDEETETIAYNNNKFYNNTLYDIDFLTYDEGDGQTFSGNEMKNNIFHSITTRDAGVSIAGFTFDYNNFYNSFTPYGTNTNVLNPSFVDFVDFVPLTVMPGTTLTSVKYDYNKLERKDPPTIGAVESPTIALTEYPVLSNFRVENATPARVYFDSSESITGSTFTGFTISGKTITNLFINGTNTENHYFTVSSAFTFWDNNTIKYVGGSDIIDIDSNSIFNFTLQHLVNNIAEPTPTRIRYASLLGGGANTGVDAANAWSYSQAGTNAIAGDKVYFLNGNYGAINIVMSNNGTIDAPIWFIGYNATDGVGVTPTGITKSVGMTFNSAKMPLLVGTGVAITVSNTYSIVKNFQTDGYTDGVMPNGRDVAGGVYFDNLYLKDGTYGVYLNDSDGYNFRMKNSYVGDMTALGITSVAESSLLENNFISSSKIVSMDYYIGCYGGINGDGFIIKDNYIQRFPTDSHSGHGVSIRSGDGTTNLYCQDGLIENNTVVNMGQALEARHNETINNVWRNNIVNGGRDVGVGGVGVSFHDGGHYNIFEGGKIYNVESAIRWYETIEDDITGKRNGHSNVFRNIIISDTYTVLDAVDGTGGTWFETIQSNSWENCTFYDSGRLYNASGALYEIDNTNSMTNCIFDNILTIQGTENIVFDHNNFTSGFTATGTNSSTDAPSFVDLIDFVPSNSALKSGTPLTNVKYDASIPPVQRNFSTPTKGAKEI